MFIMLEVYFRDFRVICCISILNSGLRIRYSGRNHIHFSKGSERDPDLVGTSRLVLPIRYIVLGLSLKETLKVPVAGWEPSSVLLVCKGNRESSC